MSGDFGGSAGVRSDLLSLVAVRDMNHHSFWMLNYSEKGSPTGCKSCPSGGVYILSADQVANF